MALLLQAYLEAMDKWSGWIVHSAIETSCAEKNWQAFKDSNIAFEYDLLQKYRHVSFLVDDGTHVRLIEGRYCVEKIFEVVNADG